MLPAAAGEEAVVTAADELGTVLQRDRYADLIVDQCASTSVITYRRYEPWRTVP